MAIPPCQGPFNEGANIELNLAFLGARADLEDGFSSFDPLGQCNDPSSSIEECRFAAHEILIGTPLCT